LVIEEGHPDALNSRRGRWRARIVQGLGIFGLITGGIIAGAKLWRPVQIVEQRVTSPIREVVKRGSPLDRMPDYAASACPSVVSLRYAGTDGPAPQAVLISGDGLAVTAAAVPQDGPFLAKVGGRDIEVSLEAHDPLTGVSLLKLDAADLPFVTFAELDIAPPGQWGLTLSSPNGTGCIVEQATVASDFVTDGAAFDYYLRIHATGDAAPAGTPFFSPDGRIVALAQPGTGQGARADRYLPADMVAVIVSRLMRTGESGDRFGMVTEDLSPTLAARLGSDRGRGAVVVVVAEGSVAQTSGLRVGDIILSAAHTPISSSSELARALGGNGPIEVIVSRGHEADQRTFTLTPAKAPDTSKTRSK
jgi:serine protease Do